MFVSKSQFERVLKSPVKSPVKSKPIAPTVKNGGAYKYPPHVKSKQELDLAEAKANLLNIKASEMERKR